VEVKGYLDLGESYPDLPVFQQHNLDLVVNKKFKQLWNMLGGIGTSLYREGFSLSNISMPKNKMTRLDGCTVTTNSIARVVSFKVLDVEGPIVSDGLELNIHHQNLVITVKWKVITDDQDNIKIGFYTTNSAGFDADNNATLIITDNGPALYTSKSCKRSGKLIFTNVPTLYVAVDHNVRVLLKVYAELPDSFSIPMVTPQSPYLETISVYCGEEYVFPVYNLTTDGETITKTPNEIFDCLARLMDEYLKTTSLTIRLWTQEPRELLSLDDLKVIYLMPTFYSNSPLTAKYFTMVPGKLPYLKESDTVNEHHSGSRISLRLNPPPGYTTKITYSISIGNPQPHPITDIKVTCQWMSVWNTWTYHRRIGAVSGSDIGDCVDNHPPISDREPKTSLNGGFLLKQDADQFNITVYVGSEPELGTFSVTREYVKTPPISNI
jgi:hypothetical protein